jgi:signal peptidase I
MGNLEGEHSAPGDLPPRGHDPTGDVEEQKGLRFLLRVLLVTAIILVLVRVFVLEPYGIPTGSMRPTIIEGDVLLVSKLPYTIRSLRTIPFTDIPIPYLELPGLGELERGDVVVFDYPTPSELEPDEETQFVKRTVAIAGDTIHLVEGRIRVNGHEEMPVYDPEEPRRKRRSPVDRSKVIPILRTGEPVVVPFEGYEIAIDSMSIELWRPWIASEGVSIEFRNRIVFLDGLPATFYTFRRNYFFALGDNSPVSRDSRYFGFIPYERLVGQAWLIYWSRDPDTGDIRWSRIGTGVE